MLFFSWLKIKDFLKPVELSQWDNSVTVVKICFFKKKKKRFVSSLSSKGQVLKLWLPAFGATGRSWSLQEIRPNRWKLAIGSIALKSVFERAQLLLFLFGF